MRNWSDRAKKSKCRWRVAAAAAVCNNNKLVVLFIASNGGTTANTHTQTQTELKSHMSCLSKDALRNVNKFVFVIDKLALVL